MKQIILSFIIIFLRSNVYAEIDTYSCLGNNWVKYRDEKCFKFIDTFATRERAAEICTDERQNTELINPTLTYIKSEDEQQFITEYLFNKSGAETNVWIGAHLNNESRFIWNDGSEIIYSNWADGSPSGGERKCVEMQYHLAKDGLRHPIDGKWNDVTCKKPNVVLCQKLQMWTFPQFQKTMVEVRRELKNSIKDVRKEISDAIHNLIPIGFIYAQLSGQMNPKEIWPMFEWNDVSAEYAGLFFRVNGKGSSQFGTIQEQDSPRLYCVTSHNADAYRETTYVTPGSWSSGIYSGDHAKYELKYETMLKFLVTNTEVRPRNMPMIIWKRIK